MDDTQAMRLALEAARRAEREGEVPVGAVLTDAAGKMLAGAGNACIHPPDPAGHAEMRTIRAAARRAGNYRLPGCRLYVTLEPCLMCAGLCLQARLAAVFYGAADPRGGALHSCYRVGEDRRLNHALEVRGGLLEADCAALLVSFFRAKRRRPR